MDACFVGLGSKVQKEKCPPGHKRTPRKPMLLWLARRRGGISTIAEDGGFGGGVWRRIVGGGARGRSAGDCG
jgi:hypothetical protein